MLRTHLILPLDDDDGHRGGRPAVLRGERLVAVPQDNDLRGTIKKSLIINVSNPNKSPPQLAAEPTLSNM